MPWFGPHNRKCHCCKCWDCDFPAGVDVTWAVNVLPDGCDCNFPATTQLRRSNSSRWFEDGLGPDPEAFWGCFARWDFTEVCCSESSPGVYDFSVIVYWVIIDLLQKNSDVRIFTGRQTQTITDSGSGTGDPCTKDWTLFRTAYVGSSIGDSPPDETIDGWTSDNIKYAYTKSNYRKNRENCPTSDELVLRGDYGIAWRPNPPGFPVVLPIPFCDSPVNVTLKT